MKKQTKLFTTIYKALSLLFVATIAYSCLNINASETTVNKSDRVATDEIKKYWYDGTAEISSFNLKQIRYGETHKGTAVLIYVTEPFSKKSNTKADYVNPDNIPVLKLNTSKKFNTGIYPYSMMNSTFFPFENGNSSLKTSSSIQEWCGMTYTEMTNSGKNLTFNHNSYFENSSFKNEKISIELLEDDLWSLIRLNPSNLPTGKHKIIPSMFFLNSLHKEFKSYNAVISQEKEANTTSYTIKYPELSRTITINFESSFPYKIINWKETYESGYGKNKKLLTTEATRIKSLKLDYWAKNKNVDQHYRNELGLE